MDLVPINPLAHRQYGFNLNRVIFKHMLVTDVLGI